MSADDEAMRVAILTPPGRGAIATVAVEGPAAVEVVGRLLVRPKGKPLADESENRILYGRWNEPQGEDVVVARRSATRVEIHCHGGVAASRSIVDALVELGCKEITWQQFVARDEPSRVRAAARIALAQCTTERTAAILLDQYQGALDDALQSILDQLQAGQIDGARAALQVLLRRASLGLHLTAPWRVVLAGPPNVGKSSLINALVGYQRVIVFDQPGTTRDVVTATTALDGWPVELSDTAGLRIGGDELEQTGIARARRQLAEADLVVLVFDASLPWDVESQTVYEQSPNGIVVHNKCDLVANGATAETHDARPKGLMVSALTGDGMPALMAAIVARLMPEVPPRGAAVPFTLEQRHAIKAALAAIERGEPMASSKTLEVLVGS